MSNSLENFARQGEVIVVAGAGVSAGKPSSLPGWKPLNAAIVNVLCRRLEAAIERPDWLSQIVSGIDVERKTDRFPPDYQAQLIEEMCGDRYFRALQALDVDVINTGHDGIAALAAAGALKAVVTTNFDKLIEQALDKRGVNYVVAYDDLGYLKMLKHLNSQKSKPLPILKIHGCVSDHLSMIDTLKQRKRGRSQQLHECLDTLQSGYWLYLGFSAADIETDPNYLGLVAGAASSSGAVFIAYPRNPCLGKGATILMDAHGDRGRVVVSYIADHLDELCRALGIPESDPIPDNATFGLSQFHKKLEGWAGHLSPSAAGLCLAAILEATGQAEPAVRILDRLVRKELYDERDTSDFHALQLHYGRLGGAWGLLVSLPDLRGTASNASVEAKQSLFRLLDSELGFVATSLLACLWLWMNDGQQATGYADRVLKGFLDGKWEGTQPRSDEEAVDAWLSAAMVCIFISDKQTIRLVIDTADAALDRAKLSGDVVRTARVAALKCLALAETTENVPALLALHEADFTDAMRVSDGVALGMRTLALARWFVGVGGRALVITDDATIAQKSLELLKETIRHLRNQGMAPWVLYALAQQAKAHADLHQFDDAQTSINEAADGLELFPILGSHVYEAAGQIRTMWGDKNAVESFQAALEAAEDSGLLAKYETIKKYVSKTD